LPSPYNFHFGTGDVDFDPFWPKKCQRDIDTTDSLFWKFTGRFRCNLANRRSYDKQTKKTHLNKINTSQARQGKKDETNDERSKATNKPAAPV